VQLWRFEAACITLPELSYDMKDVENLALEEIPQAFRVVADRWSGSFDQPEQAQGNRSFKTFPIARHGAQRHNIQYPFTQHAVNLRAVDA
jgi:hypothetical protein